MTGTRLRRAWKPARFQRAQAAFAVLMTAGFVVLGVTMIARGWHTRAEERVVPGWVTTTGTVVGYERFAGKYGNSYEPAVSFVDTTGVPHRFSAPADSELPTVGDRARVAYDPTDPARAHDLSVSASSWRAPFAFGILVVTVASPTLVFLGWRLISRRSRPRTG